MRGARVKALRSAFNRVASGLVGQARRRAWRSWKRQAKRGQDPRPVTLPAVEPLNDHAATFGSHRRGHRVKSRLAANTHRIERRVARDRRRREIVKASRRRNRRAS